MNTLTTTPSTLLEDSMDGLAPIKRCSNKECYSIYLDRRCGKGNRPMKQVAVDQYICPICSTIIVEIPIIKRILRLVIGIPLGLLGIIQLSSWALFDWLFLDENNVHAYWKIVKPLLTGQSLT